MRRALVALWGLLAASAALAQPRFVASEIPLGEWPDDLFFADMDGDGRSDLVLPRWSLDAGRELAIYLQDSESRFPTSPSRLVEIKPEIIAIAIADLRPEPGSELLLFTAQSVFSLSSAIASYTGNLRPLFDWPLVVSVPDRRQVLYLPPPEDLDGDGRIDLVLPGTEGYGIFHGEADEQFTLLHQFSTVNEELDPSEVPIGGPRLNTEFSLNERDGIVLRVSAQRNTAFDDFLSVGAQDSEGENLLSTRLFLPSAITAHANADARQDLVFLNIGQDLYGQINLLLQNEQGQFADTPDWRGSIDTRGDLRLMDINGDGMQDILRIVDNSNEWDVNFYLNKGGLFDFQTPDQVMKFSGYDLTVSVVDLDNNGKTQLSVSFYTIPVINAVRNASIVRSQLLFLRGDGEQLFHTRPDFRLDQNFSADAIRGLASQINLQTDIDRNGRRDALFVTDQGTLAARSIDASLQIADTPFWEYVPNRSILEFGTRDLNGDGIDDLFLQHSTALTVLVAAP